MTTNTGLYPIPDDMYFVIDHSASDPGCLSMSLKRRVETRVPTYTVKYKVSTSSRYHALPTEVVGMRKRTFLGIPYGKPCIPVLSEETVLVETIFEQCWPVIKDPTDKVLYDVSKALYERHEAKVKAGVSAREAYNQADSFVGIYPPRKLDSAS